MLIVLALAMPLMVIFFGLWVGVPTWLVLRHPDERHPAPRTWVVHRLPERRGGHRHAA